MYHTTKMIDKGYFLMNWIKINHVRYFDLFVLRNFQSILCCLFGPNKQLLWWKLICKRSAAFNAALCSELMISDNCIVCSSYFLSYLFKDDIFCVSWCHINAANVMRLYNVIVKTLFQINMYTVFGLLQYDWVNSSKYCVL